MLLKFHHIRGNLDLFILAFLKCSPTPAYIWYYQIYYIIFGITKFRKPRSTYTLFIWEAMSMKTRKLELGERNMVGRRVTEARLAKGMKQKELLAKLQTEGIEISTPALSLLEGQKRPVSDIELSATANVLNVSVDWLLGRE
jgi:DNA-binding protein